MPASPVAGTNVILDPIVVSGNAFDTFDTPLANELSCSAVSVQSLELTH